MPHFSAEDMEFVEKYGFFVRKGHPILHAKKVDLYESISVLRNKIEIAHLSGSVGPVFIDKHDLTPEQINPELLMGEIPKKYIPYATQGKQQQIQIEDFYDYSTPVQNNFKNVASQKVWQQLFSRQFLESILLLKEINCKRIVQKMKCFSEVSVETYELFKQLSDMED